MSLPEVRRLASIPSGYQTDRRLRLERESGVDSWHWSLREEELARPFHKTYDSGDVDEWLGAYGSADETRRFRFLAVTAERGVEALVTYQDLEWNNTTWLVDIRVRAEKRRTGLGSALLAHLKDWTTNSGRRGISVETQISNYPAIQFYSRHGFQVAGFHDHWYTNHDVREQDVALFLFWETT